MKKNYLKPNTKVVNVAINRIICTSGGSQGYVHDTTTNLTGDDAIHYAGATPTTGETPTARGRQSSIWDDEE